MAELVFVRFTIAIFSADLYGLSDGVPALGIESGRLPLGEPSTAYYKCVSPVAIAGAHEGAGSLARGNHLRVTSRTGGIGSLGHGIEKCADAFLLFAVTAGMGRIP